MKIEGVYRFLQNGKCIGEYKNNITETGRILAIKTLMGAVPSFGGSIHLGVDGSYNTYGYVPTQVVVSTLTTVTLTVSSHTLSIGNTISISGNTNASLTALNGTTQVITATTGTTITFVNASSLTNGTYTTGLGTFGTLATNTRLGFRVNSTKVLSSNIDNSVAYDAILFKAKIEDPSEYKIYEVGLYSNTLSGGSTSNKNELLVSFETGELVKDSDGADFATTGNVTRFVSSTENSDFRIGSQALQVYNATNAKTIGSYNLSNTKERDLFSIAYYASSAGTLTVTFYSGTGATNYSVYTFTHTAAGYNIKSALRSSGTVTGTMDWSNITKIVFSYTPTSGLTTNKVIIDGLRIEYPNVVDTLNGLISRTALTTPITKNAGSPLDIEYHMRLSFNG